jgi:hypothetical protein
MKQPAGYLGHSPIHEPEFYSDDRLEFEYGGFSQQDKHWISRPTFSFLEGHN